MNKISTLMLMFLLVSIKSISQNATITYSGNTSLSNINNCSSCCNVFNQSGNNPTVGGFKHHPVSGGAVFDGTSIRMVTQVDGQSNINTGTAYAIEYTFKTGYNYTMTVDMGYSANPSTAAPKLTLSVRSALPTPSDTDPTSCGPVSGSKYLSSIGTVIQIIYPSQTAVKTYNVSQFSVQSQNSYLIMTISDGGVNGSTALINKITINEIAPTSTFNLSSSPTAITCGNTTPITFTATGTNVPNGATVSYSWNLGANNGWNYNGSAAPATITTGSTNTLSLTPVCGGALTNVSVTATVNSTNYNSNSTGVSVIAPSLSINGNVPICSSETYTVPNLPCGASVTWTVTDPYGTVTPVVNGNQITLNYASSGTMDLSAAVNNVCGSTIQLTKNNIGVGAPTKTTCDQIGNGSCYQNNFVCQLIGWQYVTIPGTWGSAGTGYHLQVNGGGYFTNGLTTQDITNSYFSVYIPNTGSNSILVWAENSCGVSNAQPYAVFFYQRSYGCYGRYSVSPNPVSNNATISVNPTSKDPAYSTFDQISIYDQQGNIKLTRKLGKVKSGSVNIGGLPNGMYLVEITNGTYKEKQQLIIQK